MDCLKACLLGGYYESATAVGDADRLMYRFYDRCVCALWPCGLQFAVPVIIIIGLIGRKYLPDAACA